MVELINKALPFGQTPPSTQHIVYELFCIREILSSNEGLVGTSPTYQAGDMLEIHHRCPI